MKKSLFLLIAIFFATQGWAQTTPASIPWKCDFEDPTENANWVFDNGVCANQWHIGSAVNSGTITGNSLYISNNNGATNAYTMSESGSDNVVIATRKIESSGADNYYISFDWRCAGEGDWDFFRVFLVDGSNTSFVSSNTSAAPGYSNDGFASRNILTAGSIAGVITTNQLYPTNANILNGYTGSSGYNTSTQHVSITLPSMGVAGTVKKLIIVWRNDSGFGTQPPATLDNFSITSCLFPTTATVPDSTIILNQAVINWTDVSLAQEYIIQWKLRSETSWNNALSDVVASGVETYTISDLIENSIYSVRIRSVCDPGVDSSAWQTINFASACMPITSTIWSENFSSYLTNEFPPCWKRYNNNAVSTTYPRITTLTNLPNNSPSGGACMYFNTSNSMTLVTPEFAANINTLRVTFHTKREGTKSGTFSVGYLTDVADPSTFVVIQTFNDTSSIWVEHNVLLSSAPSEIKHIAFRQNQTESNYYYWLDDISVEAFYAENLSVLSINYPPTSFIDQAQVPYVTIKNKGTNAVAEGSYTVELSDGASYNESLQGVALNSLETATFTFPAYSATATGNLTLTATIVYTADENSADNTQAMNGTVLSVPVYPHNAYTLNASTSTFYAFNIFTGVLTSAGTGISTTPFPMSETWVGTGNSGQGDGKIARVYEDGSFGYVLPDGAFAKMGNLISPVDASPISLAYDRSNHTLYILGLKTDTAYLGTIDLASLQVTPIGSTNNTKSIVGIDFADDGYLYGPAISDDKLYKIDPADATTTLIGATGFNLNYGQDVSYDYITHKLYSYAYDYTNSKVRYGYYNLTTGAFTEIAPVPVAGQYAYTTIISNTLPACEQVTAVQASEISATEATISWTAPQAAPSGGYEYYLSTSATVPTTDSTATGTATDTTTNLTNLSPNTTYYVWVRSNCGSDVSFWSNFSTQFTTAATVENLPYTTSFAATDDVNWQFANATTNKWHIGSTTTGTTSVTDGLYISDDNGNSNVYTTSKVQYSWAYKAFHFTETASYAISFNWRANGESTWDYVRAFLVPTGSAFTADLPAGYASSGDFNNQTPAGWIDLNGNAKLNLSTTVNSINAFVDVPAGYYYLVFLWANDGSGGLQPPAYIDDVNISDPITTCGLVSNITASNITTATATLTWHHADPVPANGYQYYLSTSNISPNLGSQPTDIATDSVVYLQNLTSFTSYYVWVRSDCDGDYSPWMGVYSFVTLCATIDTLPFTENFDAYATGNTTPFVRCWTKNSTYDASYPYVSTSYSASLPNSLYFYSSSTNYSAVFTPEFTVPINTMAIDFSICHTTASGSFQILAATDPSSTATWEVIATVPLSGTTDSHHPYTISLASYQGEGTYIGFKWSGVNYYALYMDNVVFRALSAEKDILSLSIPQQTGPATIDANAHTVNIEVSYGTDLATTQLTPAITISDHSTISPASGIAQNFSTPVTYTVMAEDSSTQAWTVTVNVAATASPAKEILTFNIPNSAAITIDNNSFTVDVLMPWITQSVTALTPAITTSPFSTVLPASGVAQDFTNPVIYTVTAQDGTTQDYTVTVTIQAMPVVTVPHTQDFEQPTTDILFRSGQGTSGTNASADRFVIGTATGNPGSSMYVSSDNGTTNSYSEANVFATAEIVVDFGNYAQYTLSFDWKCLGEGTYSHFDYGRVYIMDLDQSITSYNLPAGALNANDFIGNGTSWTTETYTLSGTAYANTIKKVVFAWRTDGSTTNNPPLAIDNISITGTNCVAPTRFALHDLTPASATLAWDAWNETQWNLKISETQIDPETETGLVFDESVTDTFYTASLNPSTDYYAYVQMATCTSPWANLQFTTPNPCATPTGLAATNVTANTATFTWNALGMTDWNIKISTTPLAGPDTATANILNDGTASGTATYDASNLSAQTTYYVYVQTNCGSEYSPWVTISFTTLCADITASELPLVQNFDDPAYAIGYGSYNIPCWDKVNTYDNGYTYVDPNYAASTPRSLYHSVGDNTYYSLIVTPQFAMPLNTLATEFKVRNNNSYGKMDVLAIGNPADPATYTVVQTITLSNSTNFETHTLNFASYSGNATYIGYKYYSTYTYSTSCNMDDITIRLQSDENDILTFSLAEQTGPAVIDATNHTVNITASVSSNLSSLVPTITVSPMATISPVSGEAQDFSTPFTYTVTSESGIEQLWTVTVTQAATASSEKDILTFNIPNQISSTIDPAAHTVDILMSWTVTSNITALVPAITVSSLATVSPASGTAANFTNPVSYTVTAEDNSSVTYTVTVTIEPIPHSVATPPYDQDFSDSTAAVADFIFSSGKGLSTITPANDKFVIGAATGNPAKSLYVSNNNGATNVYSENYAFATAELIIDFGNYAGYTFSFDWKCLGEGTTTHYDYGKVYIMNLDQNITSYDLPADALDANDFIGNGTSWTTETYTLPGTTYANTIKKIVFAWRTDGSSIYSNPLAIDNISIVPTTCNAPTNIAASAITTGSATLTWEAGGSETEWQLAWKETADSSWNPAAGIATNPTYNLQGLTAATSYDVKVRAICAAGDTSDWSTTITFTTPQTCNAPTGLNAPEISEHSIKIVWTAVNGETEWLVSWSSPGNAGNAPVSGSATYTLTDLLSDTTYRICVKAICISGSDTTSSADTCIEVRTTVGINDISLASGVKLYPNPASDQLTIEMESRFNTVEVINTLGQVVYRADLIDKKKVIDVTDYSAGMYYVKLQGDAGMVTRKFVKK